MAREIKLRGKRVDTGEWVYGSLVQCDITGKRYILPMGSDANESDKVRHEGCLMLFTFEVIPETIGQYTGLKDKNCVEIYEGDIVRFEAIEWTGNNGDRVEYQGVVEYSKKHIAFNFKIPTGLEAIPYETTNIEVIGDIYENKDLLKEEE